ncbi:MULTISPECIES: PASTA domain-containing protein [Streptomyces]|uniref:PASTA domain-containing protein n=1 Tax=Streptomyces TaxID=1883 RepID=UPI0004C5B487|nr:MULTISPECIES: PASTA domain-containing protein [Streptomyces]RPK87595.1 PASTA domain protein [Streptomyces sp. ADI98-10]
MSYQHPDWGQQPFAPEPSKPAGPKWAQKRIVIPVGVGLFVAGIVVGAAGSGGTETTTSGKPAPIVTKTVTAQPEKPAEDKADDKPAKTEKSKQAAEEKQEQRKVPDFVGMGLQSAQDAAQAKGFYSLKSHDSTGRDRFQALDRNWKVCSQNVQAGKTAPTDTTLDFGAVKLKEACPASDAKAPEAVGGKMPDFVGESVKAARGALDSGTSITVTDAAEGRMVLVESNWKVCTQSPPPGAGLKGQPVEFTAVKFDESC